MYVWYTRENHSPLKLKLVSSISLSPFSRRPMPRSWSFSKIKAIFWSTLEPIASGDQAPRLKTLDYSRIRIVSARVAIEGGHARALREMYPQVSRTNVVKRSFWWDSICRYRIYSHFKYSRVSYIVSGWDETLNSPERSLRLSILMG